MLRQRAAARLPARRASGSAWRARRSTPAASCCCRCSRRRPCSSSRRRRPAARHVARAGARRRLRALGGVRRRQPVRAARLRRVPRRPDHQTVGRRRRAGQARPDAAQRASSTTCGRSPGGWAGCRRSRRVGGAVALALRRPRAWRWCSCPAPVLFLLFMGTQERFFGRWLMPVFPLALPARRLRGASRWRRRGRAAPPGAAPDAAGARASLALCGQGLVYVAAQRASCCRAPTRATWRATGWSRTCPARPKIVVEPVVPDAWAQDIGHPSPLTANGDRWASSRRAARTSPTTARAPGRRADRQHRGLRAHAVSRRWSTATSSRATAGSSPARPSAAAPRRSPRPGARRRSPTTASSSAAPTSVSAPRRTASGAEPVPFNFDWSFDYYPLAYQRPGPVMTIYRLRGGGALRAA